MDFLETMVGPNGPSVWAAWQMTTRQRLTVFQMAFQQKVFGAFWFPFDPRTADASIATAKFIKAEIPQNTFLVVSMVLAATGQASMQWFIPDSVKTPGRLPFTWKTSTT